MLAFWVVEKLDVIKHVSASLLAGRISFPPYPLALEKLKKALGNRIVITVSPAAHTGFQIMRIKEGLPLIACKLTALVRMYNHL